MANSIDTAAKRAKLPSRKNPYWHGVSGGRGGLSLGYRKPRKGVGTWIAKMVLEGHRGEERLGVADDELAAAGALNFSGAVAQALQWAKQQAASIEAERNNGRDGAPTISDAVDDYIALGKGRGRLKRYVLDHKIAELRLARLTERNLSEWRSDLPSKLAVASKNRLLNDFRAALNAAAQKHRRVLPAYIPAEIKVGTKAEVETALPRHQLLTDVQISDAVKAAFGVDPEGDFGRLVLLLAATGARFSQIAAIKVSSVQVQNLRLMMPGSHKGRNRKQKPVVAVPVSIDIIEALEPVLREREPNEPLLLRFVSRRDTKSNKWIKDRRQPWRYAYEALQQWGQIVKAADLPPGTIMYSMRHSSIVRALLKGLPVRLVAASHDTSVEMIEKHYAAYITDMSETLLRNAAISFSLQGEIIRGAAE